MTIIPALPFDLLNGAEADATQVMADFNQIVNSVNSNAAASGANSDITSLSGLTTPISINQGGTNATTAAGARTNLGLGAAAVENLSSNIVDNGSGSLTIAASSVTNAMAAAMAAHTVKANITGASANPQDVAFAALGFVNKIIIQTFSSSGTYIPSAGLQYAVVEVVGGGAGGAGAGGFSDAAGGGGAGGYSRMLYAANTIGTSQPITIGLGGAGGSSSPSNGSPGGTTSFGTLFSANGGAGGNAVTGGGTGSSGVGGIGGSAANGFFNAAGQSGGFGFFASIAGQGTGFGGAGGNSVFGGGGQGGGNGGAGSTSNGPGKAAVAAGAGGGGASSVGLTGQVGGAGANGFCIITEYCSQ